MWFKKKKASDGNSDLGLQTNAVAVADTQSRDLVLTRANRHLKLGELDAAAREYRLALRVDPLYREALINLGFVLKELRQIPESLEFIERALRVAPEDADAHYLRGTLYQGDGDLSNAVFHFERAVMLRPQFEFAYRELVVALFRLGKVLDATLWCARSLEVISDSAELHFYRSNLYKHANATVAAIASARRALKLNPGLIAARSSLSDLLSTASREDAAQRLEIALGYEDLGLACLHLSELESAKSAFDAAVALSPNVADHYFNLGSTLFMLNDIEGACANLDRAIALNPDDARFRWARSLIYASPFPESSDVSKCNRTKILAGLEHFSHWAEGRVMRGDQFIGVNSPFYLAYQELDNRPVLERHGSLCAQVLAQTPGLRGDQAVHVASVGGRTRIGVVSSDIREHSVWFALIKGWLEHLDRNRFEVGIFSLTSAPDRETEWAKLHADFYVSGPKSLQQWIQSISTYRPRILIYPAIGMDLVTWQLACLRLAPTQINAWGHPETSGLPTIDLYLSGECFEPNNAQDYYSEKLVPLLNLGNCYAGRVQHSVEPDLDSLGIDSMRPILICSGTAFKYQVEHDSLFPRIASRIEGAQLIFFRQRPESLSDLLQSRLKQVFEQAGLDFDRHVRFIPTQPPNVFHGLLKRAHVALDTIGFSGYNTAIQAIESGLPIVTRDGKFLRGRLASGILRRMGITELIAQTADDYINLAVNLIADLDFQRRIRSEIVRSSPVLYNDIASVRHLEHVLEAQLSD